jgi:TM2 domain-containing membrane protein YozV
MLDSFYIRVRGRVHGPVSEEKLNHLALTGKLSRAHEISTDGKKWISASQRPELFERPRVKLPVEEIPEKGNDTKEILDLPLVPNVPQIAGVEKEWFYFAGSNQLGPVSALEVMELIRHGALNRDSPVWKQGMPQWVAVGYLPQFVSVCSDVGRSGNKIESNSGLNGNRIATKKSKTVAVLLALILGGLGIHHFYLGNTLRGIFVLCLTLFLLGAGAIVALIEAIIIACTSKEQFDAKWCNLEMKFS